MSAGELAREFPRVPRVGVGAVVLDGDRVLLVQRGRPPAVGTWSVPGGLVRLGEGIVDAVAREVREECGLGVEVGELCGVIDRVVWAEPDGPEGRRVRYHWVIIDYVATALGGVPRAGSDAADVRWVPLAELDRYDITEGLAEMIARAVRLQRGGTVS